jgi:hypothetical protein
MTYKDGRLSIRMQNVPVRQALEELARHTSVRISMADDIEDSTVSAQLTGVTPEDALHLLLGRFDAFFYYGATGSEAAALQAVWVFTKGTALGMQPVPPEKWAGTRELETTLNHTDPRVRQRAWEALMARPDNRTRDLLIQAIRGRERDEELRQRLFSAALEKGVDISPDVLSELARADSSESIRWIALDAVSQYPSARQAAEAALTDPSPAIRQKAEDILTVVSAESHRRDGHTRPVEQQP